MFTNILALLLNTKAVQGKKASPTNIKASLSSPFSHFYLSRRRDVDEAFVYCRFVSDAFQSDSGFSDRFPVSGVAPFLWWSAGFASGVLALLTGDGRPAFASVSHFFGVDGGSSPGFSRFCFSLWLLWHLVPIDSLSNSDPLTFLPRQR